MYLLCAFLIVISFYQCSSFNLAVNYPIVITDPAKQNDSYFGYTLAFRKYVSTVRLIIGAPKGKTNADDRSGLIYECSVDAVKPCHAINPLGNIARDKKNEAWIGGTIAVENVLNGYILVCGSRFIPGNIGRSEDYMPGICFYWNRPNDTQRLQIKNPWEENSIECSQGGFSAHFVQNTNKLLVGVVGQNSWKGTVNVYRDFRRVTNQTSKHYYTGYAVASVRCNSNTYYIFGAPRGSAGIGSVHILISALNKRQILSGQQMGDYFGSSLLAVDINGDNCDDLIVGAPMYTKRSGTAGTGFDEGTIYVYLNNKGNFPRLADELVMGSTIQAARFGTSLADVGDINKDGFRDIAVGAPYENGKGAVYIYHGSSKGLKKKFSQRILAEDIERSRPFGNKRLDLSGFGISITNGLDIDGNSFNDVAVGSYDSGHVVIVRSHPLVEFIPALETSVDKLLNDTKAFKINATLRYTTQGILENLDATMELAVDPKLGRATLNGSNRLSQKIILTLTKNEPRVWELTVKLKENRMNIMQPIEIIFYFDTKHDATNMSKDFCSKCPITIPGKPSNITMQIPFVTGCRNQTVCLSDLNIISAIFKNSDRFTIGSSQQIRIEVVVENLDEPAYFSRLYFTFPREARPSGISKPCEFNYNNLNRSIFFCKLGDPFTAKQTIQVDFDVEEINIDTETLEFSISANTTSVEIHPENNIALLNLTLELEADVTITGTASKEQIFITNAEEKNLDIFHIYEVTNFGPSPVKEVEIQFGIPIEVKKSSETFRFSQSLEATVNLKDKSPIYCNVSETFLNNADKLMTYDYTRESDEGNAQNNSILLRRRRSNTVGVRKRESTDVPSNRTMFVNCTNSDDSCILVSCHVPLMEGQEIANISIKMNITTKEFGLLMKGKDMIKLTTFGVVSISNARKYKLPTPNGPHSATVHTNFLGQVTGEEMSSWVLPLSIIGGIILLMILIATLTKVGFFRRSDKEKLEALKKSEAVEDFGNTEDNVQCASTDDAEYEEE